MLNNASPGPRWSARPLDARSRLVLAPALGAVGLATVGFILVLATSISGWWAFLVVVTVLLVMVAGGLGLAAYALRTLHYRLDADALVLGAPWWPVAIPYGAIDQVSGGARVGPAKAPRLWLAGYHIGPGIAEGFRDVFFVATTGNPEDLTLVATDDRAYLISPADTSRFRQELIARVEAVDRVDVTARSARPSALQQVARWETAAPIGISALLLAVAVFVIAVAFEHLPSEIPLHFGPSGIPDYSGTKSELFHLPALGLVLLVINVAVGVLLAPSDPFFARLLWSAVPLVHAGVLISALRLVQIRM